MARPIVLLVAVIGAVALGAAGFGPATARANEVAELIETLEVGEAVYYENLTIIPVYAADLRDRSSYTTLDEALDSKWLEITEVEGGRVPQVKVTNHSARYIYLMGGEILTGCRQDRLVGRDVLLGPKSKNVIVPVYCVEQGRWTYESDAFYSKKNLGTFRLRAEAQKAAGEAQSNIWSEVRSLSKGMGSPSASDRFQAVYESEAAAPKICRLEGRFGTIPNLYPDAIGVVVGVGGEITSVDVFASPSLFGRLWPKILRASALAAIDRQGYGSLTQAEAAGFLRGLHDKHYARRPAIDLGCELSQADNETNSNALVYRNAVLHLAAFPECNWKRDDGNHDPERRIQVIKRP